MDLQLAGKTAIISGGSGPLGRAVGAVLADEGANVALAARTPEALEAAAREAAGPGAKGRVIPVPCDVTDRVSVDSMVAEVVRAFGGVDILVNAAVPQARASFEVSGGIFPDDSQFHAELDVKVMGYLRCAQAVAPLMQGRGWGRIVNLSGLNARQSGSTLGGIRNVSVVALTKNLADQLGPFGINVTVVHPALVRSYKTPERARRAGLTVEELERQHGAQAAIGRMVTAQEVAWVVAFLCSPRSVSISGDVITTSGGAGRSIYY